MDGPTYQTQSGILPRVSTVLDSTMSVQDKAAIQRWADWQEKQGKSDAQNARNRGSIVHELNARYVRQGVVQYVNDTIDSFFIPMLDHLDGFHREGLVWVEEPIDLEKYGQYIQVQPDGSSTGCLYSFRLGYAGCPDLLGVYTAVKNGVVVFEKELTLCDEKTSGKPYSRNKPKHPGRGADAETKRIFRKASSGYKSFWRTCVQLAAYSLLVEECLGLSPSQQMILVGCEKQAQRFILRPEEKELARKEWLERLEQYNSLHRKEAI